MSIAQRAVNTANLINANGSAAAAQQREVSLEILRAVEELQQGSGFGSIEIVLHEGRVTQIEKREKFRFTQQTSLESARDHSKPSPTAKTAGK